MEPTYSELTENLWSRLPDVIREEDGKQFASADGTLTNPMKRYVSSIVDQAAVIDELHNRIDYITEYDDGEPGDTSELVNATAADADWLAWIAVIRGVRINLNGTEEQKRAELSVAEPYNSGTPQDIAKTAAQGLEGSKAIRVFRRTDDIDNIGIASMWDVLIVTRATETPIGYDPVKRVIEAGAKPAGVVLHHATFTGTWDAFETQFPTWNAIEAATWNELEEAGL